MSDFEKPDLVRYELPQLSIAIGGFVLFEDLDKAKEIAIKEGCNAILQVLGEFMPVPSGIGYYLFDDGWV